MCIETGGTGLRTLTCIPLPVPRTMARHWSQGSGSRKHARQWEKSGGAIAVKVEGFHNYLFYYPCALFARALLSPTPVSKSSKNRDHGEKSGREGGGHGTSHRHNLTLLNLSLILVVVSAPLTGPFGDGGRVVERTINTQWRNCSRERTVEARRSVSYYLN